jgi:hypothetical protein
MMCRRRHRKARWLGIAFHKRNIKMPGVGRRRPHALRAFMPRLLETAGGRLDFLCCHRHLQTNGSQRELTVEIEDGSLN